MLVRRRLAATVVAAAIMIAAAATESAIECLYGDTHLGIKLNPDDGGGVTLTAGVLLQGDKGSAILATSVLLQEHKGGRVAVRAVGFALSSLCEGLDDET